VRVPIEAETSPPTTVLGDWYATLVHTQPRQLVVCMNERTLLVVLVPAREINSLGVRFREAVTAQLQRIGVPSGAIEIEARAMSDVAFGSTASRSVLGCLREAVFSLSLELDHPRFSSFAGIEDYFGEYIYSTTKYRHPCVLARELFEAVSRGSHSDSLARIH